MWWEAYISEKWAPADCRRLIAGFVFTRTAGRGRDRAGAVRPLHEDFDDVDIDGCRGTGEL